MQIRVPNPFEVSEKHFDGTCPQFNLQTISGIGFPVAWHEIFKVAPVANVTDGGGGFITTGLSAIKNSCLLVMLKLNLIK